MGTRKYAEMDVKIMSDIVDKVMLALDPIFEEFGEQEVLDIVHFYYHNRNRG